MAPARLLFQSAAIADDNEGLDSFPSGVQWSPDASAIATAQDGCVLLYDTPISAIGGSAGTGGGVGLLRPSLSLGPSEHVYSFCFFPGFSSRALPARGDNDNASASAHPCCLATASRGQPARLWDCLTGSVRAVYSASSSVAPEGKGATDAIASPLALAFSGDGATLAAGYPRGDLVLFDVSRPGRDAEVAAVSCRPLNKRRGRLRRGDNSEKQQQQQQRPGPAPPPNSNNNNNSSYASDIRLPGPIGCVAFAPVGSTVGGGPAHVLAAGSYGGGIGIFDVRVGARRTACVATAPTTTAADLVLPLEFGRKPPVRITADAAAVAASSGASLAPVLAIECGGGGGNGGGVTQLLFGSRLLFAGHRGGGDSASGDMDGWDVRALRDGRPALSVESASAADGAPALRLRRRGNDNEGARGTTADLSRRRAHNSRRSEPSPVAGRHQRIQFDVEPGGGGGRFLVTGSGKPDGMARVFGGLDGEGGCGRLLASLRVSEGATANAVAVCPGDPSLLAVATGQRTYPPSASASESASGEEGEEEEREEGEEEEEQLPRAGLALWRWTEDTE